MSNYNCKVPFCANLKYRKNSYCQSHLTERRRYSVTDFKELLPLWAFKRCKTHGLLNFDQTYTHKSHGIIVRHLCMYCKKTYMNNRYDPIKQKAYNDLRHSQKKDRYLKCKYGLVTKTYNSLLESQSYQCSICQISIKEYQLKRRSNSRKNFDIDHCHKTGKIRGLLCHNCNVAIGFFNDSIKNLERAIEYLNCT